MKPSPEIYLKAIELLQLRPEECIMVAAHAYDLRAVKKVYELSMLLSNIGETDSSIEVA